MNAATLSLVAGDPNRAREFARDALDSLARHGDESYYAAATEAEADLVLGRPDAARDVIARAVARNDDDYGASTTTRRQLRLVCRRPGPTLPCLPRWRARPWCTSVATGSAHRARRARLSAEAEPLLAATVAVELERAPVGYAYEALAAGADILWAEALLEHGAELRGAPRSSRSSCARRWRPPAPRIERFHRCLEAATTVEYTAGRRPGRR